MTIEIKSFSSDSKVLLKQAVELRLNVFSDELGFDKDIIFDGNDYAAIHYLVLIDDIIAATVRWRESDNGINVEHMCVLKKYRNIGIGFLLMKYVINELKVSKSNIFLITPETNVRFFELLNFKIIGDKVFKADIYNYNMIYNI